MEKQRWIDERDNGFYAGYPISDLRKIFDRISAEDWKNELAVAVPFPIIDITCQAIEFFHGARAEIKGRMNGKTIIYSRGYQG